MTTINVSDYDSPGYEFMRSYKGMECLYQKLVALDYQQEFCPTYNCPPIHKYYFSLASKNKSEQRLLFTCLCAWLIKDKCQMNFDIVPDEYQDTDVIINMIADAVKLLVLSEEDYNSNAKDPLNLPLGRLKQGFGPEVIWIMNILADRALELMLESEPSVGTIRVVYCSKQNLANETVSCITVGKPFVGGGLTTRPLGSYLVDDGSLVFSDDNYESKTDSALTESTNSNPSNYIISNQENWQELGKQFKPILESAYIDDSDVEAKPDLIDSYRKDWKELLCSAMKACEEIEEFANVTFTPLDDVSSRIRKQLQTIAGRESSIQMGVAKQIDEFLDVLRDLTSETDRNNDLTNQVTLKTDTFEQYSNTLNSFNTNIQDRIRDLNDKRKLRELEQAKARLSSENSDLRLKEGVLLGIYFKYKLTDNDVG